jgi:hypothetical protein
LQPDVRWLRRFAHPRKMRSIFRGYHESLTATCLMRVYSSIEYSDMSLP